MPNRILREGILSSSRVVKLSWPAEVFYRRLMSVVDDFGRYHATPMLLRAGCYPLQLDKVSDADIGKWLGETRKAGLVSVFESGGMEYLELLDFRQQVRAKGSKFPDPDKQVNISCVADAQQMPADAHLDVFVFEDGGGARKRASRLPKDWALPEDWRAWALKERPSWDAAWVSRTADNFRDYWVAAPKGTKMDWEATWRKWVRNTEDPKTKPVAKNPWDGAK